MWFINGIIFLVIWVVALAGIDWISHPAWWMFYGAIVFRVAAAISDYLAPWED